MTTKLKTLIEALPDLLIRNTMLNLLDAGDMRVLRAYLSGAWQTACTLGEEDLIWPLNLIREEME